MLKLSREEFRRVDSLMLEIQRIDDLIERLSGKSAIDLVIANEEQLTNRMITLTGDEFVNTMRKQKQLHERELKKYGIRYTS